MVRSAYDRFSRAIQVTKPGPSNSTQTVRTQYNNFSTITTDPNGRKKQIIQNAIGQDISISDAYATSESSNISYLYDAIGNLLNTTDSAGNIIRMSYNAAGKKSAMVDPDLGTWTYSYNALGKMISQSNIQNQQTSIRYDSLGRVLSKTTTENSSSEQTNYTYAGANADIGSKGKLLVATSISIADGQSPQTQTKTISYDSLGRPSATQTNISSRGEYLSEISYDSYSRPATHTYPNGYKITNHYDASTGIVDFITGSDGKVHYKIDKLNAFGQTTKATYGNGVKTLTSHYDSGYIGSIISYRASALLGEVQRLDYEYDALGNVLSRTDNSIDGKEIVDTFSYDAMNRLSRQETSSDVLGNYSTDKSYRYDTLGNITFQTGIGAYSYHRSKPHAVKQAGTRTYTYDSIGNMLNRNGDQLRYNPLNKATLIQGANGKEVRFYYGVGGKRYRKQTADINTFYLGKSYEEQIKGSQEKQICYISLGGKTIGTHTQVLNTDYVPSNANYKEPPFNNYFHTDALGSITAITDDSATVIERRSYEAFGKIRAMDYGLTIDHSIIPINTVLHSTRAYTGHEQIAEISGLIQMNARLYDSDIGRFLSADTLIQNPKDSQAYNRYTYVRNNPMMFTDPSGHSWFSKIVNKVKNWVKNNWKTIVTIVAVAIVTAGAGATLASTLGLTGTSASITAGATTGEITGFTAGVVGTKANGGTWSDAFKNGLKGAGAGALGGAVGGYYGNTWDIGRVGVQATANGLGSEITGGEFKNGFATGLITGLSQWGYKDISSPTYNESGEPHMWQEGKSDVGKELPKDYWENPKNYDDKGNKIIPLSSDQSAVMQGAGKYIPYADAGAEFHDGLHDILSNNQALLIATMPPSYVLTVLADVEPYTHLYGTLNNTQRKKK